MPINPTVRFILDTNADLKGMNQIERSTATLERRLTLFNQADQQRLGLMQSLAAETAELGRVSKTAFDVPAAKRLGIPEGTQKEMSAFITQSQRLATSSQPSIAALSRLGERADSLGLQLRTLGTSGTAGFNQTSQEVLRLRNKYVPAMQEIKTTTQLSAQAMRDAGRAATGMGNRSSRATENFEKLQSGAQGVLLGTAFLNTSMTLLDGNFQNLTQNSLQLGLSLIFLRFSMGNIAVAVGGVVFLVGFLINRLNEMGKQLATIEGLEHSFAGLGTTAAEIPLIIEQVQSAAALLNIDILEVGKAATTLQTAGLKPTLETLVTLGRLSIATGRNISGLAASFANLVKPTDIAITSFEEFQKDVRGVLPEPLIDRLFEGGSAFEDLLDTFQLLTEQKFIGTPFDTLSAAQGRANALTLLFNRALGDQFQRFEKTEGGIRFIGQALKNFFVPETDRASQALLKMTEEFGKARDAGMSFEDAIDEAIKKATEGIGNLGLGFTNLSPAIMQMFTEDDRDALKARFLSLFSFLDPNVFEPAGMGHLMNSLPSATVGFDEVWRDIEKVHTDRIANIIAEIKRLENATRKASSVPLSPANIPGITKPRRPEDFPLPPDFFPAPGEDEIIIETETKTKTTVKGSQEGRNGRLPFNDSRLAYLGLDTE